MNLISSIANGMGCDSPLYLSNRDVPKGNKSGDEQMREGYLLRQGTLSNWEFCSCGRRAGCLIGSVRAQEKASDGARARARRRMT